MSGEAAESSEENRRRFPEVAAFVDRVREFWPGASVVYLGKTRSNLQPLADRADGALEGRRDLGSFEAIER